MKQIYRLIFYYLACEIGMLLLIPIAHYGLLEDSYIGFWLLLPLLFLSFWLAIKLIRTVGETIKVSAARRAESVCFDLVSARNEALQQEQKELLDLLEQTKSGQPIFELPQESYIRYCSHPLIDAILRHKALSLKERGVEFQAVAAVDRDTDVDQTALLAVLMNLIDNGADAALKTGNPSVSVRLFTKAGYLICRVENTALQAPTPGRSSKKEKGHGLGLSIVQDACKNNQGSFHTEYKDGKTISTATLRLKMEDL